jgi:hypothetical protein
MIQVVIINKDSLWSIYAITLYKQACPVLLKLYKLMTTFSLLLKHIVAWSIEGTAIARQRQPKHVSTAMNQHNNKGVVENGVFYAVCPAGFGPKNDCASDDQQQLLMADPFSHQRECPTSTNPQLSDSNKNLIMSPRWVLDTKTDWPTDRWSWQWNMVMSTAVLGNKKDCAGEGQQQFIRQWVSQ